MIPWRDKGRRLRSTYDAPEFGPGPRAELRRVKQPADILLEGHYLTLLARLGLGEDARSLAPVVWLYPFAAHRPSDEFQLGRYLRQEIFADVKDADLPGRARRIRQLVAARDSDECSHHLRRLLVHAYQRNRRPVDWGVVTQDLVYFGDRTRRRWAESFFVRAAISQESPHV